MEIKLSYFLTGSPLELDLSPGAYMISGLFPGAIPYFGGSICPPRRGREHVYDLEDGTHWIRRLQYDYDKHGPQNFVFVPLQSADDLYELSRIEQNLISERTKDGNLYNKQRKVAQKHCAGYKLSRKTRQRQSAAKRNRPIEQTRARVYRFMSPEGELIETLGLRALCEKHGLNQSHMSKVASGKARQHKGYRRAHHPDNS